MWLEGHDIETMSDDDLRAQVLDVDIFARTTPEHKLRLVSALQSARSGCGDDR